MVQSAIQTAFHTGEWSPNLYARVDLQKYHSAAALLRNFYVDYRGGASTRQGTRFINTAGNSAKPVRIIGFQPSTNVTYVLEFGDFYIRFHSNSATVLNGGLPYQIASPFAASDLLPNPITGNPGLKFVPAVTSLIICHPSYQSQKLTIISPTNWTISAINFGSTIPTPTNLALASTDSSSTIWYSAYLVTAVDVNGQESAPPSPATFAGTNPISLSTGVSFTLTWNAVSGAVSYNVYKATQSYKSAVPAGAPFGFIANVTGTTFIDSTPGIGADFSQTPPVTQNPFQGAGVQSYTVTSGGTYTTVPTATVAAPPSGGTQATAQPSLGITVATIVNNFGNVFVPGDVIISEPPDPYMILTVLTVGGGGGINTVAITFAGSLTTGNTPSNPVTFFIPGGIRKASFNLTWAVLQVNVTQGGSGYTSVPAVTFSAGAAAATAVLGTASGGNPGVPGFIQERLTLGGLSMSPQSFDMSQPGSFFNFNISNPIEPDDAINASLVSENLNDIRSFLAVPTGLLAFTGRASWLLNGGGGISTQNPITPSNITALVQSFNGANDMPPLKINFDALYVTNKGNYVRDLNYNIYAQVFSGSDISVMSSHLFFNHYLIDWAWSEEPFKTVLATRDDGVLLSLGYVKEQELIGWAHHDTNGQFKSVCTVYETVNGNVVDAVYVVVQRFLNGASVQCIERMADRFFTYGHEDSWSVDCALQTTPFAASMTPTISFLGDASAVGNTVTITAATAPFTSGMVGWTVRAGGGIYTIATYISSSQVTATVKRIPTLINQYTGVPFTSGGELWQPVTSVSGLNHLIGQTVTGVADGTVVSGTVSGGGSLALGGTFTKVTIGLAFTPQLQTLPLDLGQPTVQGRPKQINAVTVRVADTLGLSIGKQFSTVVPMKESELGNQNYYLNAPVTDLIDADTRTQIDSTWDIPGQYCIEQTLPYPATILGVIPEFAATQRQA